MMEDNSACVTLSMGHAKSGKHGHFRRMVAYLEGLTNRGTFWLDNTPSKENPSDILTKSVTPADQFYRMRDVINGSNPVLFVSTKVKEICQLVKSSALCLNFPESVQCRTLSVGVCIVIVSI